MTAPDPKFHFDEEELRWHINYFLENLHSSRIKQFVESAIRKNVEDVLEKMKFIPGMYNYLAESALNSRIAEIRKEYGLGE